MGKSNVITMAVSTILVKRILPFFIKHIWPLIQAQVTTVFTAAITSTGDQFRTIISNRTHFREQEATVRAEEAEQRATTAHNRDDAIRYQTEATVWRQVAEGLRHDNERLQLELRAALQTAIQQGAQQMKDVTLEMKHQQVHLKAGNTVTALPLPLDEP